MIDYRHTLDEDLNQDKNPIPHRARSVRLQPSTTNPGFFLSPGRAGGTAAETFASVGQIKQSMGPPDPC